MRYSFLVILVIGFALLLTVCDNAIQETATAQSRIRAALESSGTGSVKAAVFIEGPDGNALSGAIVTIKDSRNAIRQLTYDATACSYTGVLEEIAGITHYTVEAASILSDNIISLTIPYSRIANVPNATIFQDAAGNSVLSGKPVSAAQPIQIGWADCGENVVYQVAIKTALKSVFTVSTNACTVTLGSGSISPGAYLLEISAQKIYGDILFRSSPYYSASYTAAPLISCNVD